MSKPLSSRLANIEPLLSCRRSFDGTEYVSREYHDSWMEELKLRWERDKAFARRIALEHGYDIDELAAQAPEYA